MTPLLIPVAAAVLSYVGVSALRRWAGRVRLMDIPTGRSSHSRPTPRGGGLAIVVVVLVGLAVVGSSDFTRPRRDLLGPFLGACLITGVGFWDDVRPLPWLRRFSVQFAAAAIAVLGIAMLPVESALGRGGALTWVEACIGLIWVVGLTNAYNFMDGIDGIAGGQGVVAGAGWTALGWLASDWLLETFGLVVAGACLGFLAHNWAPARVFMGDVGSTFLGYSFAVVALIAYRESPAHALPAVLLVWPFVFDTTFTVVRRLSRRENIAAAHRSHLYQRLVITGLSHATVAAVYIGLAGIGALAAVAWRADWPGAEAFLATGIPGAAALLWLLVIVRERSGPTRAPAEPR